MPPIPWYAKALRAYAHLEESNDAEGLAFARGYIQQAIRNSAGKAPPEWAEALKLIDSDPAAAKAFLVRGFGRVFEEWEKS